MGRHLHLHLTFYFVRSERQLLSHLYSYTHEKTIRTMSAALLFPIRYLFYHMVSIFCFLSLIVIMFHMNSFYSLIED